MKTKYFLILLVSICSSVHAQSVATALLGIDINGATVQVSPVAGKKTVLIFTATDCPYDDQYISLIQELADQYGDQIGFFLINASPEDTPERIREQVAQWKTTIPYIRDNEQVILKALSGRKTMEAFVLTASGAGFKIVYRGPIDDNPQVADDADYHYLADAISQLIKGNAVVVPEVRATGCVIRNR